MEVCDGINTVCPPDSLLVDGATCDDGDECTKTSVCKAGVCEGRRSACNCVKDADCDDHNDCTTDKCVDRECKYEFREAGKRCNDGDPCSIFDKCTEGGRCEGSQFCENDSDCLRPGPFCRCSAQFEGLRCQIPRCDPPDLCGKGGVCATGNTCRCYKHYEGDNCEVYTGPTKAPTTQKPPSTKKPRTTPIRKIGDLDIGGEFSWNKNIGGGLYWWTVAVISAVFVFLCLIGLFVTAWLLKHFIVDPVDKDFGDDMF